jgi:D-alanyl-lipoteichoic acid acyltransferase DltB (MBOAT superfamily)
VILKGTTDIVFLSWMVASVAAYWATPARLRTETAILTTAIFLALADPISLCVFATMTAVVFVACRSGSATIVGAIVIIIATLFAFKAIDPNRGVLGDGNHIIPLGLSFFTLRCVHVLIERYLQTIRPPNPRQLVGYLFFLPTIIAGPVHRYPAFISQHKTSLDWSRISNGLERILYGYVKIIVISNYLLSYQLFPKLKPNFVESSAGFQYLDCLDFGLNLYFQFSGYSDIAIGFALLLNKKVMENFDLPLLRTNLVDFWRNWHMSMTSWCREYVFTTVYALSRRRSLSTIATMLAIGLWHGLTLNFIAWGLYHGIGIVASQLWGAMVYRGHRLNGTASFLLGLAGWFVTFNYVIIGFAWTKERDIASVLRVFGILLRGIGLSDV